MNHGNIGDKIYADIDIETAIGISQHDQSSKFVYFCNGTYAKKY